MSSSPAAAKPPVAPPGHFNYLTNAIEVDPPDDAGRRRFHTIMSSTIKDRAHNEVRLSALEDMRDAFAAGLAIYRNHEYVLPDSIFGQSDSAEIRNSGKTDKDNKPIWDLHVGGWVFDKNVKALELAEAISAGVKVGASIGAWPIGPKHNAEGGLVIEHMEVGEGSIVAIPKNQRSLVQKAIEGMQTWSADIPTEVGEAGPEIVEVIVDEVSKRLSSDVKLQGLPPVVAAAETEPETTPEPVETTETAETPPVEETPAVANSETTVAGQEAIEATPETAADDAPDNQEASAATPETVAASDVAALVGQTRSLIVLLGHLRDENATLTERVTAIEKERDQLASENLEAAGVIEKVMKQPLRARSQGYIETFTARHPDFLAPEVASILRQTTQEK